MDRQRPIVIPLPIPSTSRAADSDGRRRRRAAEQVPEREEGQADAESAVPPIRAIAHIAEEDPVECVAMPHARFVQIIW